MSTVVTLGASAVETGRPFTHLDKNEEDLASLRYMAGRLRGLLRATTTAPAGAFPLTVELSQTNGRRLRIVLGQWEPLHSPADMTVVGFFGQRRPVIEPEIDRDKDIIDTEMIAEFPQYPGVLSYCSMELDCGNFGNLVLLRHAGISEHWMTSARHAYATRIIAPRYYNTIRLHNGLLPGGLAGDHDVVLLRTKYYDFQGDWPWLAVREYAA
jgi:hypothetical protein